MELHVRPMEMHTHANAHSITQELTVKVIQMHVIIIHVKTEALAR